MKTHLEILNSGYVACGRRYAGFSLHRLVNRTSDRNLVSCEQCLRSNYFAAIRATEEYQYSFYWVSDNLKEIPMNVFTDYINIPWRMRELARLYWNDRWEEVKQMECLVPLYIRNIDTGESLIAK